MTALLDTSILVGEAGLGASLGSEEWVVSIISVGELEAGLLLAGSPSLRAARLRRLASILAEAPALAVDRSVAARYGELRAATGRLPSNDLWIAATALAYDFTLVTADQHQAALPLVRTALTP